MQKRSRNIECLACLLILMAPITYAAPPVPPADNWAACGWGGGGFFYAAAYHPTQDGVIYMGGDVNGVYKTEDHGRSWRMINNGIANYGIFSLAVDRSNPQTVYAATEGGLCKSIDAGEHWVTLPKTGRKELRITGEKGKSIRAVAVDPADGQIVYAASPAGKVYKSIDGGQKWAVSYEKQAAAEDVSALRVRFGKSNDQWFGGLWLGLEYPKGIALADCVGFGFAFRGDGHPTRDLTLTLKLSNGAAYRSKNLRELFASTEWRDVVLKAEDFVVDPDYARKNPDQAKSLPATIDWSLVNRLDCAAVGPPGEASVAKVGQFFYALTRSPEGKSAPADKPILLTARGFAKDKTVNTYGNIHIGSAAEGSIYSVAVAAKDSNLVLAATETSGLVISEDGGKTWREIPALPRKCSNIAVAPSDSNIIYASFFTDGIWRSADRGKTWASVSEGLGKKCSILEVVISPANPLDVFATGPVDWNGNFYASHDGGKTWADSSQMSIDKEGDPTIGQGGGSAKTGLSAPTNLVINPTNPKELFISANWRSCLSEDGGKTWAARNRGADISCIYDIRFSGPRAYACAMDEGAFVTENDGKNWRQIWPTKYDPALAGHAWRLQVSDNKGVDRIIGTFSPWWAKYPGRIVISEDGGKTHQVATAGLPDYIPSANTMWGAGNPRALAVDPRDPRIVYLGMDGDPSDGKAGGGIFKSEDGGKTWKHLAKQPGSRRVFFGLAVDPTDSKRLFWAGCGAGGGVYRSEDSGESWQLVFSNETWLFNIHLAADGAVYAPGKNLWRSTDHGKTWKQLTKFAGNSVIVGLETDPRDSKTIWLSHNDWGGDASGGGVYKTRDGGANWNEITGNIPYRKPMVLRFNPATQELWAGGVGLYRIPQPAGQ